MNGTRLTGTTHATLLALALAGAAPAAGNKLGVAVDPKAGDRFRDCKPSFLRAAYRDRMTTGVRFYFIGFRVARMLAP